MGKEKKRKNIVLLMTDQLRGDCMGCAGHPDVKTPYLDTLASKGIRFPNAYSACPSCVPARAALHTGLTQESHRRVGYSDGIPWNYPSTMAGELTKAGYYTQCVGKMHVDPLRNYLGFCNVELHDGYLHYYRDPDIPYRENQKQADDYFHWLKQEKGIDCDVTDTGLECNSWVARPWIYEEKYHPTNWVTDRSIDFLRRRDPDMPFFLFASYLRPHPPFDAPQCYFDMYSGKGLTPPAIGDWCDDEALRERGRIFDSDTGPLDPELVRQMQIGYYACVTHLDHQIGRLLQALIENKLYEDTIILFVSDHGELLGDHHLFRKSRAYQGSSRIPFIISGGGAAQVRAGRVSRELVELRDVMPTVLEAAGVAVPDSVEGISLWDMVQTENGFVDREYLHGEHALGAASSHWIVTRLEKYIWYSQTGEEQYFRIGTDENELHNLVHDELYQDRVGKLRELLIHELEGREEGFVKDGRLVTGCEPIVWLTKDGR